MPDLLTGGFKPSRSRFLPAFLVSAIVTISLAPPLALAQSARPIDPYTQGPTRPLDGSPRSGVYSARSAPSYERVPQRLGNATPPPTYQPPIWNGVYIGANAGLGWQSTTFEAWGIDGHTQGAGRLGGHVGYNWQIANLVLGLEGDLGRDVQSTTIASAGSVALMQASWTSTVRARAGVSVGQALIYATGGAAFGNQKTTLSGLGPTLTSNDMRVGTVLGAGVEFMLAPRISTRMEALRYDFREPNASLSIGGVKQSDTVVRAGLTIHLN